MCVISCILKMIFSIINSILMIAGLILLVVGALLMWGVNAIIKVAYDLQYQVQLMLNKMGLQADASGVIGLIQQNSVSLGAVAFSIGIILVAISILGIIAVCCCSLRNILIVICIFLIVLTLGLLVLVIYFGVNSSSQVFNPLVDYLQKNIINEYRDINSTEPKSILVNVVQISANCCGLYNYMDFNSSLNFNRVQFDSSNIQHIILFPLSCCNYKQDLTLDKEERDKCIRNGDSTRKNVGCWKKLEPELTRYFNYCLTSLGITIGILVATIIITIIMIKCVEKIP